VRVYDSFVSVNDSLARELLDAADGAGVDELGLAAVEDEPTGTS